MRSFEKYPRALRYVAGLEKGLNAYPQCVQKAAVLRQFVQLAPDGWGGDLPAPLDALVRDPPPLAAWIPEVQATALYLAMVDARGWEDQDFVAESLEMNRELLKSPLYRILMTVVTPSLLVRGGSSRWAALHRGTEILTVMSGATSAQFTLKFPRRLVPTLIAQCYATGFQAALEGVSAKAVVVTMLSSTEQEAAYRCDWS